MTKKHLTRNAVSMEQPFMNNASQIARRMGVPANRPYRCMHTAVWPRENELLIRTYVIDDYFGTLSSVFTFEGDSVGILSCRSALNALRAKNPPKTVNYRLVKDGEPILSGTVSHVGAKQPNTSPRVETLDREMTLLKLKYELAQSGISAETEAYQTVGISGKTIRVTVKTSPEALQSVVTSLPAALESVNEQGGGIVRCDVLFTEAEGVFAAVSYDLVYGDTLYSSAFSQD